MNPTGRFVIGGPVGDSGLTGRKIIVDTYGGYAAHGGGAFSGKDPTKVDRSAAYMARYIAKNLVAAALPTSASWSWRMPSVWRSRCLCSLTATARARWPMNASGEIVRECFDLRPSAIIKTLDLRRPIYQQVAAYGHFGRPELDLPWEKVDQVQELLAKA